MADRKEIQIETIASIMSAIASSSANPQELAEVAFLEIARLTEPDIFEIGLFEDNGYRTLIRVVDGTRQDGQQITNLTDEETLLTWIRENGESLLISNLQEQIDTLPDGLSLNYKEMPSSGLYIPLIFGTRVLGALALQSHNGNAFDEMDRDLLRIIATGIAPALATSGLVGEIEFLTLQMLLIQQVSKLLMTLEPLPDRMARIVEMLSHVLEIEKIELYEMIDDEVRLRAHSSGDRAKNEPGEVPEIVTQAIASGKIQSVPKQIAFEELPEESLGEVHFAFPLKIIHHRLGALHLCCPVDHVFDEEQIKVLETVSQQLAFAVLEARNYAQHQQEAWVTTVLLEVARHAAQPGDPVAALQAVLQLATLLVGTEWIVLLTHDASTGLLHFTTSAGLKRQQTFALAELEIEASLVGLQSPYYEDEQPLILDIPTPMDSILEDDIALALILSDGQDLLGVLLTENEQLSGKQPSLMAGIAHQISLRLENSRLIEQAALQRSLERELAMARDIQASFLPSSIPEVPGWELGVAWRVAREVGGDFYDFIPLPPGEHGARYGIAIADVADKGIPAALYMALSRTLLRTLARDFLDPGACLERVNQQLIHDTHADLFVSIFYAVLEPALGRLRYANAGHNPPMLFTPRERGVLLRDHGMVLGVQSSETYQTHEIDISEKQMLVLYTDGVTDALDANDDFFGMQRLESLVLGMPAWQAQTVADRIEERVLQFTGRRELFDDLTTVILHR